MAFNMDVQLETRKSCRTSGSYLVASPKSLTAKGVIRPTKAKAERPHQVEPLQQGVGEGMDAFCKC